MSILELNGISMRYPGAAVPCIQGLELTVEKGEIVTLLGESGCGKTTLLKLVAGLETPAAGTLRIAGKDMNALPPEKRPIAMVFQKALLFENMSVGQNVSFSPRLRRTMSKAELRQETARMLALVGLEGFENRRVTELSGGQEQRVSLARALMAQPEILLLDEPLSALDANLKLSMEQMIRTLNRELGTTMLYVTHDQNEAASVADRIALLHSGSIVQVGKAEDFYSRPKSRYAAEFFGCKNILPACKAGDTVTCALGALALPGQTLPDGDVLLCVRSEAIRVVGSGPLKGLLQSVTPRAADRLCMISCGGEALEFAVRYGEAIEPGQTLCFDLDPSGLCCVPAEIENA